MTKQSLFQLLADNQIETLFQELKGSNNKYLNDLRNLHSLPRSHQVKAVK